MDNLILNTETWVTLDSKTQDKTTDYVDAMLIKFLSNRSCDVVLTDKVS